MISLRFFLTARHWQVFLLLVGLMVLGQLVGVRAMLQMPNTIPKSPEQIQRLVLPFLAMSFLFMLLFLAWLWTLGEFLTSAAPASVRLSVRWFRLSLVYPVIYFTAFAAFVSRPVLSTGAFAFIVPLHLLAMFCMFYNLYFVAKSLRIAEVQRAVSFYEYFGAFFLLWFYPVGVWIVQPRVNALAQAKERPPASGG